MPWRIVVGILMVYLLWILVRLLKMELLSMILGQIIGVGVIALIVVFQPEVRRFLAVAGDAIRTTEKYDFRTVFQVSRSGSATRMDRSGGGGL